MKHVIILIISFILITVGMYIFTANLGLTLLFVGMILPFYVMLKPPH